VSGYMVHSRGKQHRTRSERITEAVDIDYAAALTSRVGLHGALKRQAASHMMRADH
jgi:hypothetical protein